MRHSIIGNVLQATILISSNPLIYSQVALYVTEWCKREVRGRGRVARSGGWNPHPPHILAAQDIPV